MRSFVTDDLVVNIIHECPEFAAGDVVAGALTTPWRAVPIAEGSGWQVSFWRYPDRSEPVLRLAVRTALRETPAQRRRRLQDEAAESID